MDNAMEAVIISDENLLIVDANKTAEKIFGYKLEEVKGKSLLEFTPKDDKNELFNNYERLEPFEIVRKRKDGFFAKIKNSFSDRENTKNFNMAKKFILMKLLLVNFATLEAILLLFYFLFFKHSQYI
jgi:PAS domain-containing protein